MVSPILIIIISQALFSASDVMGRIFMPKYGFNFSAFLTWWFLIYFVIRIFATIGQLYVLANVELGKTIAIFGAVAIIIANVLGILLLKEVLSPWAYVGVVLAILAFFVLALS